MICYEPLVSYPQGLLETVSSALCYLFYKQQAVEEPFHWQNDFILRVSYLHLCVLIY